MLYMSTSDLIAIFKNNSEIKVSDDSKIGVTSLTSQQKKSQRKIPGNVDQVSAKLDGVLHGLMG